MTTTYAIGDLNPDEWLSLLGIASASDPKLAAISALSWGGAALKVMRVNATENGWELVAVSTVAEPPITAGTTAQYWRGDKSWQTLDKTAVGLGSVDNTADAAKNVLTATTLFTARNFSITGGGITAAAVGFNGSAAVTLSASVDAGHITLARMADVATSTVFYRKTAGTGAPEVQTLATLKTDLGLTGTNSGDQTSIVGITGTKAQFNTANSDGDFVFTSDLGTGVGTFLATPSSANLRSAVTDETGTGALVFANTPTLVTPDIGAATGTSLTASATVAAGTAFKFGTTNVITLSGNYHVFHNPDGSSCFYLGNSGDPSAYLDRDNIFLRSSGGATRLQIGTIGDYANDAAAAAGGVAVNQVYRNGSVLMVRVT